MATIWPRINTVLLLVTLLAVIGLLATRAYGGPLDPPGAPATGTDGVRGPGTPISSLPFATTQGGYYYVTRPLSASAGQYGITICCSNTTIDLGGFTITGAGAGMSPGDGISNSGARNIVIRNGAVRGWFNGIALGGTYSRVEHVQALSNLADGIFIASGSEVVDCNASLNGAYGIHISYVTVRNCTMSENAYGGIALGNNSLVEDNRVNNNNATSADGIDIVGNNNTLRNNDVSGSGASGAGDILVTSSSDGTVLLGNVFCSLKDMGTDTFIIGNVDRVSAC